MSGSPPERDRPRVVVVGGGIAGLTAAWALATGRSGTARAVTVLEAGERLGGKVATERFAGIDLDCGPDSFLARTPAAVEVCRAVGLGDQLVSPGTGTAYVWSRRRLRRLPAGLVLGVPTNLGALARSHVLSLPGTIRAALDLLLPRTRIGGHHGDVSVGELARARFGSEALSRLIDPLVGGINAGRADELSAAVVAPAFVEASNHRSLILGLRRAQASAGGTAGGTADPAPVFLTVRGGLGRLVDALAAAIVGQPDAEIRTGEAAIALRREVDGPGWEIESATGARWCADAVVIAVPAQSAGRLLAAVSPAAAAELATITYSSVCLVTLAYAREAVPGPLDGSGFLVPRIEGRLMTACSWVNTKWPHLDGGESIVLRVSAGRAGDARALSLSDSEIVGRLHQELTEAMGICAHPAASRVHRWVDAFPQYAVGHQAKVARIETALQTDAPGVVVTGAAYRGVGLATCMAGAQQAAATATAMLATGPT